MEVVYFVLGVVAVLSVLGILIVFGVKNKIEQLEEEFKSLERGSHDVVRDLHIRIEDEVRDLKFQNNETILEIERELHELKYIVDSRFDKFESKIKKEKDLLKG